MHPKYVVIPLFTFWVSVQAWDWVEYDNINSDMEAEVSQIMQATSESNKNEQKNESKNNEKTKAKQFEEKYLMAYTIRAYGGGGDRRGAVLEIESRKNKTKYFGIMYSISGVEECLEITNVNEDGDSEEDKQTLQKLDKNDNDTTPSISNSVAKKSETQGHVRVVAFTIRVDNIKSAKYCTRFPKMSKVPAGPKKFVTTFFGAFTVGGKVFVKLKKDAFGLILSPIIVPGIVAVGTPIAIAASVPLAVIATAKELSHKDPKVKLDTPVVVKRIPIK